MHVGADLHLRGPAAELRRPARPRALAPAPRPALPPEARLPAGRRPAGPFWVDDPAFNLEYHVRHSALPSPGLGGAAAQHGGARLLPAARPHQAALGAVDGPGPDPQALRASSPRPTTRWSTASPASTSRPCSSTSSRCPSRPSRTTTGSRAPSPSRRPAARQGRRGASRARRSGRLRRIEQAVEHPRRRCSRSRRRPRRSARSAGTSPTRRRRCRSTSGRLAPPLRVGARRPRPVQADQGARSAEPSTTSSSPSSPARCAAGCTRAGYGPRESSCAPRSRSRSAPRTSAASSATGSPRCAARSRSTSRTR